MASVPIGPGALIIQNNMREARCNGMSRGMATPATYYWFYQKVRNRGPWDYKQFDYNWAAFETSILVPLVERLAYPMTFC